MTSPSVPAPLPLEELVGKRLKGQYLLQEKLGQGGMGAVFRAINERLKKPLAVKVLLLQAGQGLHRPEAEARFEREIQLAGQMAQANIAQVFDCGVEYGYPFMVMEYVEGPELSEMLRTEGPLPERRALDIIYQLALALAEAERCGVVHRDIKPQNIKLQRYSPGGELAVKVLDFGIAKNVRDRQDELTKPGTVMGTPAYMAPEQCRGSPSPGTEAASQHAMTIDGRADLYSTGVILYEMLTGYRPFEGDLMTMIGGHLFKPPPPLPASVSAPVRAICERLLRKNPEERFQSASELLAAIRACQHASVIETHRTPAPRPPLVLMGWLLAGSLLALLGLLGFFFLSMKPPAPTPVPAPVVADLQPPRPIPPVVDLAQPPPDLTAPEDLRKPVDLRRDKGPLRPKRPDLGVVPDMRPASKCPPGMFLDSIGRCSF